MHIATWISIIMLIAAALVLIVLVLMQDNKGGGVGSEFGGNSESFFGRNRSKTKENRLVFLTKVVSTVIAILCVVATLLLKYYMA